MAIEYLPPISIEGHRSSGAGGPDHPMRIATRRAAALDVGGWTNALRQQVEDFFDDLAGEWHTRASPQRTAVVMDALVRGLDPLGLSSGRRAMHIGCRLLLPCVLVVLGCGGNPAGPDRNPEWLTSLIQQFEAQPVANPPAFVARYQYRGAPVYYLPARCCDIWSTVYQADGTILCHPDGGLGGSGDGRCPTFLAERANERIVWRDPRRAS